MARWDSSGAHKNKNSNAYIISEPQGSELRPSCRPQLSCNSVSGSPLGVFGSPCGAWGVPLGLLGPSLEILWVSLGSLMGAFGFPWASLGHRPGASWIPSVYFGYLLGPFRTTGGIRSTHFRILPGHPIAAVRILGLGRMVSISGLVCAGLPWYDLVCTGLFWSGLALSGLDWSGLVRLVCSGLS